MSCGQSGGTGISQSLIGPHQYEPPTQGDLDANTADAKWWPPHGMWECIMVDKVYDSCQRVEMNDETFDLSAEAVGEIQDATCKKVELVVDEDYPFECNKLPGNRAEVSFYYRVKFYYEDDRGPNNSFTSGPIPHTETVAFFTEAEYPDGVQRFLIQDPRIALRCEVFLFCDERVGCVPVNEQKVLCCINKLMVFKLVAQVQLEVWSRGFCPPPRVCDEVEPEVCPEPLPIEDLWPPYAPQPKT